MKKSTRSFLQKPSTTGVLIGVLAVAFSVVGLLLVQTPLEKPQDVRRQASIDNGEVTVSHTVTPDNSVVGTESTILFAVNTAGIPTDGIQVLFNVVTDTFDTMTADIETGTGLQSAGTQVERTADGFLVQALALPAQIGQPFITTDAVSPVFLRVKFTPTKAGTVAFNFDREESISILHDSNPLEDKLNHIAAFQIAVATQPGTSPSPSPSTSPSPTPAVTPSPSPTPAVGGINVVSCNAVCSSNAECGINQRCYSVDGTNRCRLAVNPTNDRCITAETGPNYSCNHGCADTHECSTGLTCWYNKCREPLNVESTSCASLTTTQTASLVASCNVTCSANADCDINLRCYQGACRLATNPSSSTCSAATAPTISKTYTAPKGGAAANDTTKKAASAQLPSDAKDASTSAGAVGATASAKPSAATTIQDQMKENTEKIAQEEAIVANESALDVLLKMLKTPDSALPLIIIGAGIGLLILALIIIFIRRMMAGSDKPTSQSGGSTSTPTVQPKPEPVVSRTDLGTPLTTARSMTTPTASMPTQHTLQQQSARSQAATPLAQAASPHAMPPATTQPAASGDSSMLQRMKNKGIALPNSSTEPPKQS